MKAIIRKELREQAFLAFLCAVALLGAFAFLLAEQYHGGALTSTAPPATYFDNPNAVYSLYLTTLLGGAVVIALLLGVRQVVREQSHDARAFLIHRPLSAGAIYAGKTIAGLGLYLAATLSWLVVVTAWFMTPGVYHFPGPFDIRLVFPQLLNILMGASYYFAGQLLFLRPTRWWGSHMLPLAAAVLGLLALTVAATPLLAVLGAVLFPLVLGWAAYGSYLTRGEYAPQTRPQRAALGLTLLFGGATAVVGAGALLTILIQDEQPPTRTVVQRSSDYALTQSDRLVSLNEDWGGPHGQEITSVEAMPSGRALPHASKKLQDYSLLSSYGDRAATLETRPLQPALSYANRRNYYNSYPSFDYTSGSLSDATTSGSAPALSYFYNARYRVVEVFDRSKGRIVGYLGTTLALAPTIAAAEPFNGESLNQVFMNPNGAYGDTQLLYFPAAIYKLDARKEQLSLFAAAPGPAKFRSVALFSYNVPTPADKIPPSLSRDSTPNTVGYAAIAAFAGNQIHLYDASSGREMLTVPYAANLAVYDGVNVAIAASPLRLYTLYSGQKAKGYKLRVTQIPSGATLQELALPPTKWQYIAGRSSTNNAAMTAMPLAALGVLLAVSAVERGSLGDFNASYLHSFVFPALLWCSLGGILSIAVLLLILLPRYGWHRKTAVAWSVGVFFLSWTGLLMIAAMIPFQQRVHCPNCGRKRSLAQAACEYCRADSLAPAPDGREIFEPPTPSDWMPVEGEAALAR